MLNLKSTLLNLSTKIFQMSRVNFYLDASGFLGSMRLEFCAVIFRVLVFLKEVLLICIEIHTNSDIYMLLINRHGNAGFSAVA